MNIYRLWPWETGYINSHARPFSYDEARSLAEQLEKELRVNDPAALDQKHLNHHGLKHGGESFLKRRIRYCAGTISAAQAKIPEKGCCSEYSVGPIRENALLKLNPLSPDDEKGPENRLVTR